MKRKRLPFHEFLEIEKQLSFLPHPLRVEREGKGPVRVYDEEGNEIKIISYNQLPSLLAFIKKNCPHDK
jgi:hypothetical protein